MYRSGSVRSLGVTALVPVVAAALAESDDAADIASSRLSMAVAALVVLAVVIAVSTIVFWRMTKPDSLNVGEVGIRWIQPDPGTGASADDNAPTQGAPAQNAPAQNAPAKGAPTQAAPTQAPVRQSPPLPTRIPPLGGVPSPVDRQVLSTDPTDG